jgi:hypothetical protein
MRYASTLLVAALAFTLPTLPAAAREKPRYEYNGRYYTSLQECLARKKRAEKRGTIAGAAAAGIGAALLGGNLGETALVAGGGAVAGNVIAGKTNNCERRRNR